MRARMDGRIAAALLAASTVVTAVSVGPAHATDECADPCAVTQSLRATVMPGSLVGTVKTTGNNPNASTVRLERTSKHGHGKGHGHGHDDAMSGALNTVTVSDLRGGHAGWKLTATITDLTDGRRTIGNSALRITPTCRTTAPGSASGIKPGPAEQRGDATLTLCTKDRTLGASGSTGGVYDVGGAVTMKGAPPAGSKNWTAIIIYTLA